MEEVLQGKLHNPSEQLGNDLTIAPSIAMSTSVPILAANFPHAMAAGQAEDFQIYVLEQP